MVSSRCVQCVAIMIMALSAMVSFTEKCSATFLNDSVWVDPEPIRILYIGNLNFDCIGDTIYGTHDLIHRFNYTPSYIAWGKWDSTGIYPCGPDSAHHVPHNAITTFQYPTWRNLLCTVAIDSSNQDTIQDLTIFIYGQVGDTAHPTDTARAFTIFGQNSLDSAGVINLGLLGTIQYTPYFAVELLPNQYLVDREARDPSGDESYRLLPINQPIPKPVEKSPPTIQNTWSVRLYPNPAVYSTNLEIMSVPPGEYHVEIVASNGIVEHRQELTIGDSGELLRALDLQALPSGYYAVRLFSSERLYGAYPVLVTK